MALVETPHSALSNRFDEDEGSAVNVFLKMWDGKTLCCRIDPKQASITKLDILNERVLEEYPSYEENYFFEMQGKPLNGMTCNSLMWMDGSTVFVQYRNRGGCFMEESFQGYSLRSPSYSNLPSSAYILQGLDKTL